MLAPQYLVPVPCLVLSSISPGAPESPEGDYKTHIEEAAQRDGIERLHNNLCVALELVLRICRQVGWERGALATLYHGSRSERVKCPSQRFGHQKHTSSVDTSVPRGGGDVMVPPVTLS